MIPERLGTAAMTIGATVPALDVATDYIRQCKAFGTPITSFQGVSFQVAEAAMLLDASRSMVYTTKVKLYPKSGVENTMGETKEGGYAARSCFCSGLGVGGLSGDGHCMGRR
jgi:alkylation response protein AidB-like acyl-CoA dehydrogenase